MQQSELGEAPWSRSQPSSVQGQMRLCNILLFLTFRLSKGVSFPCQADGRGAKGLSKALQHLPKARNETSIRAEGNGVTSLPRSSSHAGHQHRLYFIFYVYTNPSTVPSRAAAHPPVGEAGSVLDLGWQVAGPTPGVTAY